LTPLGGISGPPWSLRSSGYPRTGTEYAQQYGHLLTFHPEIP
jgi:hypothetical protein